MLLRGHEATGPHHAERADLSADGALTIEGEIGTNDDMDDYGWEFHVPTRCLASSPHWAGRRGTTCSPSSKPTPTLTSPPTGSD